MRCHTFLSSLDQPAFLKNFSLPQSPFEHVQCKYDMNHRLESVELRWPEAQPVKRSEICESLSLQGGDLVTHARLLRSMPNSAHWRAGRVGLVPRSVGSGRMLVCQLCVQNLAALGAPSHCLPFLPASNAPFPPNAMPRESAIHYEYLFK